MNAPWRGPDGPRPLSSRVPGEQIIPGLEVHDLLEVGLGGIVGVEKSSIVWPQHVLPPAVLGLGQGNLLLGHEAS